MSNMTSARNAIAADLQHARNGIAFYANRIKVLEDIKRQLDQIKDRPGPTARIDAGTASGRGFSAIVSDDKSSRLKTGKLPATKAVFWLSLLSETPISNKDILAAAIAALKLRPDPVALQKLKQRLANAINLLTKDGSMQSAGVGRTRRFSVKAS